MDSRDETLTSGKSGILTGFDVINRQHKNTPQEEFLPRKNVKTHENEPSSGHTPINYAPPNAVTKDQVQDMIGQAMNTFAECRRQENEQFSLSMQNVITIQFFNLGVVLLQNLQQAQMSMLGVVASPAPHVVAPAPPAISKVFNMIDINNAIKRTQFQQFVLISK
ncbi:hypothetical protein JHK84_043972 [Glycine max]|nr:hypothetical protein JHK84_043972 [Glycine max]